MQHTNLIGNPAPHFEAKAVLNGKIVENFSLANYQGQYVLFFFYPLDFTFVCPTELHAFQENLRAFRERDCEVIAVSVDSANCHLAWLNTPREYGGIEGVTYPLVSDMTKEISRHYGVLKQDEGIAYRGLFLIDKEGIIRHQLINDLPLGRSCDEALRILDALIYYEENGEVCPANWKNGDKALKPTQEGLREFFGSITSLIK
jgi:peroxiredoxin (alkyl hydroperoxide reductase subunit C)